MNTKYIQIIIISGLVYATSLILAIIINFFIIEKKIVTEYSIDIKVNEHGFINNDLFHYYSSFADNMEKDCRAIKNIQGIRQDEFYTQIKLLIDKYIKTKKSTVQNIKQKEIESLHNKIRLLNSIKVLEKNLKTQKSILRSSSICKEFVLQYQGYFDNFADLITPLSFFTLFKENIEKENFMLKVKHLEGSSIQWEDSLISFKVDNIHQEKFIKELNLIFQQTLYEMINIYEQAIKRISPKKVADYLIDSYSIHIYETIYSNLKTRHQDYLDRYSKEITDEKYLFKQNFVKVYSYKINEYTERNLQNYILAFIIATFIIVLIVSFRFSKVAKK